MNCTPVQQNDRWACCRCGYAFKSRSANPPHKKCAVLGWGDKVEWLLSKVGITKARVTKVTKAITGKPTCGCSKRQQTLNEIGETLSR